MIIRLPVKHNHIHLRMILLTLLTWILRLFFHSPHRVRWWQTVASEKCKYCSLCTIWCILFNVCTLAINSKMQCAVYTVKIYTELTWRYGYQWLFKIIIINKWAKFQSTATELTNDLASYGEQLKKKSLSYHLLNQSLGATANIFKVELIIYSVVALRLWVCFLSIGQCLINELFPQVAHEIWNLCYGVKIAFQSNVFLFCSPHGLFVGNQSHHDHNLQNLLELQIDYNQKPKETVWYSKSTIKSPKVKR